MVDVVITYVDGDKGNFKNDYNKLIKKEYNELRFRSYGVLDLQIKLIRKYMSFVDNIFVIVSDESQIPDNFDTSLCKFVYHRDIIPQKYLPTFNSCCIEMFMHKIPELNNKFIYFNDDIFCIDTLSEDDFFINDKPCLYPLTMPYNKDESIYINNLYNSTQEIANLYKTNKFKDKYIKHTHIARPFLKTTCQKILSFCKDDILNSLTRTRHSRNFNATLFNNYDYITNKYIYKKLSNETFNTFSDECIDCINNKLEKIICINDNYIYINFNDFKEDLKGSLEANLYNIKYVKPNRERKIDNKELKEIIKNNNPIKVALCAIAKNENLYIREWVEWYKNLGISKIFIYDNNDIDGERFEEVINDYIESNFVEIINVRGIEKGCVYDEEGINLQPKCYIEFYEGKGKEYDWICFFDVDEFLDFKNDYSLYNFLNQDIFYDCDTILIPWEHYDDNGLYDYDKRDVVKRFTHKSKLGFHGCKSIVKTNKNIYDKKLENLIHCFRLEDGIIKFSNGLTVIPNNIHNWYKVENNIFNSFDVVLNHYKTKTISEYLYRHLGRHWGTGKKYTDFEKKKENCYKDFFLYNEKTKIKEEFINSFTKDNNILNYYKKINSLKIDEYIEKYDNFISKLSIDNFISKKYNKEIGIISLTTWKARIDTVYITLCNLLDMCPGFHIVLVLSEDEFPYKENELPDTLKKLISNKFIEILWTPNNYKTCKKLIFTIEKYIYEKVPIITADDDCLYITNYAKELYNKYKEKNNYVIRYNMYNLKETWQYSQGPCTLYNPITFKYFLENKQMFLEEKMAYKDDQVITKICKENKIKINHLYRGHIFPFVFINESSATNDNTKNIDFINCYV